MSIDNFFSNRSDPPLHLTDQEQYEFELARFRRKFLWVNVFSTGRVLIGTPTREPIKIVTSLNDIKNVVNSYDRAINSKPLRPKPDKPELTAGLGHLDIKL